MSNIRLFFSNVLSANLTDKLDKFSIKHTVHEPSLYLSVPFTASVKLSDGSSLHAKPPSYSINCETGVSGELHYVPAHISRDIENLFDKSQDKEASTPDKVKGKIIITEGFSFPGKILDLEKAGAAGVIAVNPGVDIHWGICTSIWGTPEYDNLEVKPNIPVVAVNLESGNKLIELSKKNEKATTETTISPLDEKLIQHSISLLSTASRASAVPPPLITKP